jgi:hypothetical protein
LSAYFVASTASAVNPERYYHSELLTPWNRATHG